MAALQPRPLEARHIQNMSDAQQLEPHWGYADRVLPCTSDSCEYLDLVYKAHDNSMLYSGIMYAVVAGLLLAWAIGRRLWPRDGGRVTDIDVVVHNPDTEKSGRTPPSTLSRARAAVAAASRRHLLPEAAPSVFGPATRLQVLVLAVIAAYLIIFSFAGMWYRQWITPAKNGQPGVFTTRTTLGPWSNRVGVLAYALTPFSVMLSSRESLLSLLTGLPYQSFNFLHRWLGYIIVAQGVLHTVGWLIIELYLYQPQPYVPQQLFKEVYMWWGCIATFLLLVLFALATPWGIRTTGYEFFRKAHYVLAMVYIGAIYGHWDKLSCFLIPALLLWGIDRFIRLVRSALLHYRFVSPSALNLGFKAAQAEMTLFTDAEHGDVVRLDFEHPQDPWNVGQHFYLCFPSLSIWQSHPFTPLSLPRQNRDGTVRQSYVLRAKRGETKKLAELAVKQLNQIAPQSGVDGQAFPKPITPVVLSGSYGESTMHNLATDTNVLCIAGGTGITYVLPVLLDLVQRQPVTDRRIDLIWAVRRRADLQWVTPELTLIQQATQTHGVAVRAFITREAASMASESSSEDGGASHELHAIDVQKLGGQDVTPQDRHPDLSALVDAFQHNVVRGSTAVFASGPGSMIRDLRKIIAGCNSVSHVWKGDLRSDVQLICDNRLE
ncbi:ferric reductase like transmembrane component-domain-containing protein [Microdochium bolleyi]|uniref:Ferric reductase like transmembrane component-domain-containing protein n=1 Tax=Microdochium bolleyi TaxID=196109 RepID=A0A136IM03_9PEZI|nr:ferric reductase like transmembrane component-domain-containing protein [Microdochium bolleyi]